MGGELTLHVSSFPGQYLGLVRLPGRGRWAAGDDGANGRLAAGEGLAGVDGA